ncbi:MAG: hypothetical protein AABX38_05510 [Candidatus Micrarchaeota archaeon]
MRLKRLAATAFLCVSLVGISPRIEQSGKFRALGENMAYAQKVQEPENIEVQEAVKFCKKILEKLRDNGDKPIIVIFIANAESKLRKNAESLTAKQREEIAVLFRQIEPGNYGNAKASMDKIGEVLGVKNVDKKEDKPKKEEPNKIDATPVPVAKPVAVIVTADPMNAHVKELLAGLEDMLTGKEREHETAEEVIAGNPRVISSTKPEVIDALGKIAAKLNREMQKLRDSDEKTKIRRDYDIASTELSRLEDSLKSTTRGRITRYAEVTDAQVKPIIAKMKQNREIFVETKKAQQKEEDDLKAAMKTGKEKTPNLIDELKRDAKLWSDALARIEGLRATANPQTARFLDEYVKQTRQRVQETIEAGLADLEKLVSKGEHSDAEQKARFTDVTGHKLGSPSNAIILVENIIQAETYLNEKSMMPNSKQMTPTEYFDSTATKYGAALEKLKQNERTRIYGEQYNGRIEEGKKSIKELQEAIKDAKTKLNQNVQDNSRLRDSRITGSEIRRGALGAVKDNVDKLGKMPVPVEPAAKEVYSIQGLDKLGEDHNRIEYGVRLGGRLMSFQDWQEDQKKKGKQINVKGSYQMEMKEEGGKLFIVQPNDEEYKKGKVYAGVYIEATGEIFELQWKFDTDRKRFVPILEVGRDGITNVKTGAVIGSVDYNRESHEMKPTSQSASDEKFLEILCEKNIVSPKFNERHGTYRTAFVLFQ